MNSTNLSLKNYQHNASLNYKEAQSALILSILPNCKHPSRRPSISNYYSHSYYSTEFNHIILKAVTINCSVLSVRTIIIYGLWRVEQ